MIANLLSRHIETDLDAIRNTWAGLTDERRALLQLLSRFDLTYEQARRWFDGKRRERMLDWAMADAELIENPYRIVETDVGDENDRPIGMGKIDRGLLPDASIAARHPVPEPTNIGAANDARRVRGAITSVLRHAASGGDSLLSTGESSIASRGSRTDQADHGWSRLDRRRAGVLSDVVDRVVRGNRRRTPSTAFSSSISETGRNGSPRPCEPGRRRDCRRSRPTGER